MEPSYIALQADAPARALSCALYSPKETEAILNISHATCYRLINRGLLDARKIGSKTVITAASIQRLLADLPRAACAR